ncbi:hypothetical protein HN695_06110 [Candidatus Woesearchaeota archaeon]|jgi:hypothetical protein|nr:hypothetical protein [Candidatus Woesearchaeota archaeon]MBT5272692.1 hypothetical protein [Candidatus Woesearchaeota archaeon]MBT6040303.1 hypothetical protein [Candidatus Woesearchaeota archaeon]MBT6337063.1 hypothetical protein [Candidatus Woesearchaeota archaeon]MBT7927883.1 hypothetical protein [Candidatus Woesearchaeota archaeon]
MEELFTLEQCKTDLSCKAKLIKRKKLNLANIKDKFDVVTDAGIALVLSINKLEVVVHGFGEIVFKTGKNIEKVKLKKIAQKVFECGLNVKK